MTVKVDLFREKHILQSVGHLRSPEQTRYGGCQVFTGLGNSSLSEWEEYSLAIWGKGGDFQELGHHPPFDLDG